MNTVHKEIAVLNCKVDTLNEIVKRLNCQLQDFLSQNQNLLVQHSDALTTVSGEIEAEYSENYAHHYHNSIDHVIDDNSVLEDLQFHENSYSHHCLPNISAELQIQRLTAQLTAAYNRIAALEEQLLARRI